MKKGKITMIITIGLVCFILTTVMFMQFKIVNETDITSIETMREAELTTELSNWKEKYDEVNKTYEETQGKIDEYKQKKESDEETSGLLSQELEQTNMALGKTDVQGEGIVITLKSKAEDDINKIEASDLLIIVNALKIAGAEAISINGERITNMSDIVLINETFVKINGQRVLEPYVIKVIGNQTYLESALLGKGGYVDDLKKLGHDISIDKNSKVTIEKYNDEIKTKYME